MELLYIAWQCTWGALQTLLGLGVFFWERRQPHFWYHGALVTRWRAQSSLSLGMFVFVSSRTSGEAETRRWLIHEYGHTIQSLLLGPLYLPVIGLPSLVWKSSRRLERWRRNAGVPYTALYSGCWADCLGEMAAGEQI